MAMSRVQFQKGDCLSPNSYSVLARRSSALRHWKRYPVFCSEKWFAQDVSVQPLLSLDFPDCRNTLQGTCLPLTTWFLALYMISQAKTGLSALALKRQLGVSSPTAWRIQHKLMQFMLEREVLYTLQGAVQTDDAYLGGENPGPSAGSAQRNHRANYVLFSVFYF